MLGYCFECGDYIAEGDACHYHVMSMFSKCIIKLFFVLTLSLLLRHNACRRTFLCRSAVSECWLMLRCRQTRPLRSRFVFGMPYFKISARLLDITYFAVFFTSSRQLPAIEEKNSVYVSILYFTLSRPVCPCVYAP